MAYGLFGGFILGFLGTAMPRMLSAEPLRTGQVLALLGMHLGMVFMFARSKLDWGDRLFFLLLVVFVILMLLRARTRKDLPPPGFVLVGMAILCALCGAGLSLIQQYATDIDPRWILFQRLLSYQGFVLLPILGIGPFILPRFFGMQSAHDFPEALTPSLAWKRKAILALGTGGIIVGTFLAEADGHAQAAYLVRFLATLTYLLLEFPIRSAPQARSALGGCLRLAFVAIVAGFLGVALFPAYRSGVLHLTLIGGFALLTFLVATRVVYGHSGNIQKLKGRNRWLLVAVGAMLFAMATRISGDFWPKIMASHYSYGALLWVVGVLVWAAYVLPKVLIADVED
jgi:hypothetical protein